MKLTDNEKRDVMKYLEAGKPLPDKYRFLLFSADREVELVWNGKTDEVTNVVLPFQVIEQIDEPRGEGKIGMQNSLFDTSGRQIHGWTNKLIWGDNKLILSSLKNGPMRKEIEAQGGLKLIYIDPPFDVGADFSMDITIGDREDEQSFTKKPSVIEEIAYRDTWGKGADSFIAMIYERLKLMHGLLAEDGSIYVHCDWRVNSYMRLVLDEIFGTSNFKNEITWKRSTVKGGKTNSNQMARNHDSVLYYTKSSNIIFNRQSLPFSEDYKKRFNKNDNDGNGPYRDDQPVGTRSTESLEKMKKEGKVFVDSSGKLRIKSYLNDYDGVVLDDNWLDISEVNVMSKERAYYPTQKPEALIERIVKASTNEGDLVADFFCGSGTTLAVAEKLGRKWIGSDLGKFGIHTTRKRMVGVQRELKKQGKDFRPFEILNVGKYERQNFLSSDGDMREEERLLVAQRKEREFVDMVLAAYKAEPLQSFVNMVGKKRDRVVAIGPINMPVSSAFIRDIFMECKDKGITKVDVLGFDYEMGLDFGEYTDQGVDIAFRIIPKEVFDKKAIEKGQVKFYDVAFVEVKPIVRAVKGKPNLKELAIGLTDFSVFYNQDANDIDESLKSGGTKVVVENGQVVKISKDKKTDLVTREVLTKKWSDWIDYWAVDFNFSDRKEFVRIPKTSGGNLFEKGKEQSLLEYEESWTGDYIFDNEWQSFRTKKNRNLEFTSVFKEMQVGTYKVAVKVVDIFGNDTTKVIKVVI